MYAAISLYKLPEFNPHSSVHLERSGHIKEEIVRFWIAELACALEYLHRQRIIHRYVVTWQPGSTPSFFL